MSREELTSLQRVSSAQYDPDRLVELQSVDIDRGKPIHERVSAYLKAVGNPYLVRVGCVTVRVSFSDGGKPLADAIAGALLAN